MADEISVASLIISIIIIVIIIIVIICYANNNNSANNKQLKNNFSDSIRSLISCGAHWYSFEVGTSQCCGEGIGAVGQCTTEVYGKSGKCIGGICDL